MQFKLGLKIAQIPCILTCENYDLFKQIEKSLNGFRYRICMHKGSHIAINVTQAKVLQDTKRTYIQDVMQSSFFFEALFEMSYPEGKCTFDLNSKSGDIIVNCSDRKRVTSFIHFSLRQIYGFILPLNNSIAMHASSVFYKDTGIIFAGPSGAGKTTVTKLLSNCYTTLHDDLAFVGYQNKLFYIYAPPVSSPRWNGLNYNKRAPLKKIFFLKQGSSNKIHKIPVYEALKRLMQSAHGKLMHHHACNVFHFCSRIVNTVPVHILEFSNKKQLCLEEIR